MFNLNMFNLKFMMFGAAVSVALAGVSETYDDDLPSKFDASTGYVTMKTTDSATATRTAYAFRTNNLGGTVQSEITKGATGSWNEEAAQPHSGTNYYVASKTLCTDNSAGCAFSFAGDKLVIGSKGVLQGMSTGANYPTVDQLYMLGNSRFYWSGNKNKISGKCHIRRSSSSPVLIYTAANVTVPFGMDVEGDASQKINIYTGVDDGATKKATFKMTGDWSEYYGSIAITNTGVTVSNATTSVYVAGPSLGGKVLVTTNCIFGVCNLNGTTDKGSLGVAGLTLRTRKPVVVPAGETLTVGDLAIEDEATITLTDASSRLIITNSCTFANDHRLTVNLDWLTSAKSPAMSLTNIVFEANVNTSEITTNNFLITGGDNMLPTKWPVLDDGDDGKTRLLTACRAIVQYTGVTVNSDEQGKGSLWYDKANNEGKDFWTDGLAVHDDADYIIRKKFTAKIPNSGTDVVYVFPGSSLSLAESGFQFNTGGGTACGGLYFKDLRICNDAMVRTYSGGTTTNSFGQITLPIFGKITVASGAVLESSPYNSRLVCFEGELTGAGSVEVSSHRTADKKTSNKGWSEFTGLNTNFTGRISINHAYSTQLNADGSVKYVIPDQDVYVKLYATDGRNFGGPLATFDADSLLLRYWGCLIPRNSMTLDQTNRGVTVSDVGQMQIDNGVTLTIMNKLTLKGRLHLRTEDALGGTLALGGALAPTMEEGKNLITVTNVCVQALSTNSFDGAALSLGGTAAIVVDPAAEGDVATYGFYNVKGTITAENDNGNKINVRLVPSVALTEAEYAVAICTVPSAAELSNDSFSIAARPHGYKVEFLDPVVDETAGTTTFRVKLTPQGGIFLLK